MSRQLPAKPSLSFLKKQAKELLRAMPHRKLADAQHQLATEYGFASWAKLKFHVEGEGLTPAHALQAAVCDCDAVRTRELLQRFPQLRATINDPLPTYGFGQHALYAAVQRSDKETIQALLDAGADIAKRTEWWAGSFGLLEECDPGLVEFLVERGAVVDVHAAARLGLLEKLRELVAADAEAVHRRGGDGQMPLHFASTVDVAEFLLERGAELDARDVDHESTAAQYMLRVEHKRHYQNDRQPVARYLVARGCHTDLLLAAALGNLDLVRRLLDEDPGCIAMRVSDQWFPKRDPRAGGTIYIWQLGANRTAHSVARDFGHEDVFQLLLDRTPDNLRLAMACELGDEATFREYLAKDPAVASKLSEAEQQKLPAASQSNNFNAVKLMLEAGWPVNTRGEMGATALHWAGFNGNKVMAEQILRFGPDLAMKSLEYAGTAVAWAIFGSGNSWHSESGDYPGTIQAMLAAGAAIPSEAEELEPSDAVLEMLP